MRFVGRQSIVIPQRTPVTPFERLRRQSPTGRTPRGGGLRGLGAEAEFTKWLDVYVQQKNQARRVFGSTNVNEPGRTDIQRPNLSGRAGADILRWWYDEIERINLKVALFIPNSANVSKFQRDTQRFQRIVNVFYPILSTPPYVGALIPTPFALAIWNALDPVVGAFGAVATTPSTFSVAWSAVKEAIKELPGKVADAITVVTRGTVSLLKVGAVTAGVVVGLWGASKLFARRART